MATDDLARQEISRVAEAEQEWERILGGARREQYERGVIRRLRTLVVRVINAENALHMRRDGEAVDPMLLWMDLIGGDSAWSNADTFRQWLGIPVEALLPRGGPGADDRGDRELARVRAELESQLVDLIVEWRGIAHPELAHE